MSKNYKDLDVWNKSTDLFIRIHNICKQFPREELFSIVSQMKRCSVSIPSNIAEGSSRSIKDFIRFLTIARGSSSELYTQIYISYKLEYIDELTFREISEELDHIGKMLSNLIKKLNLSKN